MLRIVQRRSTGVVNAATGVVTSFSQIAQWVGTAVGSTSIALVPRSMPMPHNGYRAFDTGALSLAFPDFRTRLPQDGLRDLAEQEN